MGSRKKNISFRKTKKALQRFGAHLPSRPGVKKALAAKGRISRTLTRSLLGLMHGRKTATARLRKTGAGYQLDISK